MKTHFRSALAAGIVAASLGAGCVAIIATDDDDHYAEDCSDCHTVIVYKSSPSGDSTAVAADTTVLGECTR